MKKRNSGSRRSITTDGFSTALAVNKPKIYPFRQGDKVLLAVKDESWVTLVTQWINDHDVHRNLTIVCPMVHATEIEYLTKQSSPHGDVGFGIVDRQSMSLIGMVGLHNIKPIDGTATAGIFIGDKAFWGKGLGTEAMMLLLDYAFNTLNLRYVQADVYAFNCRSQGHLKKCGYATRCVKKNWVYRDGVYVDVIDTVVSREQFQKLWKSSFAYKARLAQGVR
jgi:RimJ/RimL family protein N-acetyltransferase